MKHRIALMTLLCAAVLTLLCSCSAGISGDEAKEHVSKLFSAVSDHDFEAAATCLHPDRPADLEEFFTAMEEVIGQPMSAGLSNVTYTGFRSAAYDSTVGGATYTLTMTLLFGDVSVPAEIELVRNKSGFGVYNLYITP